MALPTMQKDRKRRLLSITLDGQIEEPGTSQAKYDSELAMDGGSSGSASAYSEPLPGGGAKSEESEHEVAVTRIPKRILVEVDTECADTDQNSELDQSKAALSFASSVSEHVAKLAQSGVLVSRVSVKIKDPDHTPATMEHPERRHEDLQTASFSTAGVVQQAVKLPLGALYASAAAAGGLTLNAYSFACDKTANVRARAGTLFANDAATWVLGAQTGIAEKAKQGVAGFTKVCGQGSVIVMDVSHGVRTHAKVKDLVGSIRVASAASLFSRGRAFKVSKLADAIRVTQKRSRMGAAAGRKVVGNIAKASRRHWQRVASKAKDTSIAQLPLGTLVAPRALKEAACKGIQLAANGKLRVVRSTREFLCRLNDDVIRNVDIQTCAICCDDVPPNGAVRLLCLHGWYCNSCVTRYTEAQLDEGAVQITCPECRRLVHERNLRSIVPGRLVERLQHQSVQRAVAASKDIFACPTPDCPMRVSLKRQGGETCFHCEVCSNTACVRCGMQPFHSGQSCQAAFAKASDDNRSFLRWMAKTGTKQCPNCMIPITKENLHNQDTQRSECHKMWCRSCGTRFCFKCLTLLTESSTCNCTKPVHGFINPHTGRLAKDEFHRS